MNELTFRKIAPQDVLPCLRIDSVCFEYDPKIPEDITPTQYYQTLMDKRPTARIRDDIEFMNRYAAFDGDKPVSAITSIPFTAWFDGHAVGMTGIGSVVTLPTHRRRGTIKTMMGMILAEEYENKTPLSYLYPFSSGYYAQFGYAMCDPSAQYTYTLSQTRKQKPEGTFELYTGDFDITGFQQAYERMPRYNTLLKRERCDFRRLYEAAPYETKRFAYLYRDANTDPRGYILFRKVTEDNRTIMDVTELVFDTWDTLQSLLGFAHGFASDYELIRFHAPLSLPIEDVCADYPLGKCERELLNNGMVRVVHTQTVLELAQYRGSGTAVVAIDDGFLKQNHCFEIEFRNDTLQTLQATTKEPTCRMDINTFSQAIIGRFSAEQLIFKGVANVPSGIFYQKPCFINNYF